MKILGIDPSTRATGWCVLEIEGGEIVSVESGVIKPKTTLDRNARLMWIATGLRTLLQLHKWLDAVAYERSFVPRRNDSAIEALGQIQGAVILVAGDAGIPVIADYSPQEAKLAATGDGKADKATVQRAVNAQFGLNITSLDESDAVAVALAHWAAIREREVLERAI